jgi:hypothetical protein
MKHGFFVFGRALIRSSHHCEVGHRKPSRLGNVLWVGPEIHHARRSLPTDGLGHVVVVISVALFGCRNNDEVYRSP